MFFIFLYDMINKNEFLIKRLFFVSPKLDKINTINPENLK